MQAHQAEHWAGVPVENPLGRVNLLIVSPEQVDSHIQQVVLASRKALGFSLPNRNRLGLYYRVGQHPILLNPSVVAKGQLAELGVAIEVEASLCVAGLHSPSAYGALEIHVLRLLCAV